MPGDSVKVAVRVRPFNQRERNAGSKCIISMKDKTTVIKNPDNNETKTFTFDQSYWSHDDSTEDEKGITIPCSTQSNYADQRRVFSDLGQGVLDNAWQGYNAALFAYGQTGSGKSYSMIGYGPNRGIVPITCGELFKAIEENTDSTRQLQVRFSMLEIYNEQVRDLLATGKKQTPGGLKVRQNPKTGFYVEELKEVPVQTYKQIERLMDQGTLNRTTASTNMNATSSRSHMVITIKFNQVFLNEFGQSTTKSSDINLVDLAGSERADSTGATGDRLKEGSAINQSLSTLGNVISALADQAMGKRTVIVPYRDSVLTKLLQSALGGNSRTIMIAAISPADINYDETLSTLRYADRAKKIQNKAVINESPTERLIRELKEENAKLMEMLKSHGGKSEGSNELQKMLEENRRKMDNMQMSWEQRLEAARQDWEKSIASTAEESQETQYYPYLTNVNEDPQLTGVVTHCLMEGKTKIGKSNPDEVEIVLRGLGIQHRHVLLQNHGKKVTIEPMSKEAQLIINGVKTKTKTTLQHLDRIKLGSNTLFLFIGFPKERSNSDQIVKYDFDMFVTELAEHEGLSVELNAPRSLNPQHDDSAALLLFQEFVNIIPKIAEANAISEELQKCVVFDAEVKSHASHDPQGRNKTREVIVRVMNKKTKKVWVWSKAKFINRKFLMDEMYLNWTNGERLPEDQQTDPFWDPVEDVFLGSCHVWLQALSYCMDVDEHFTLHNYHGKEEAVIHVKVVPCDAKWKSLDDDAFTGESQDLIGRPFYFQIRLQECMGVKWVMEDSSRGVYSKVKLYNANDPYISNPVWSKSYTDLGFKENIVIPKLTEEVLFYIQRKSLVLELWGSQCVETKSSKDNIKTNHHSDDVYLNGIDVENDEDFQRTLRSKDQELDVLQMDLDRLKKENFKLKQVVEKRSVTLSRTSSVDRMIRPPTGNVNNNTKKNGITKGNTQQQPALDPELAKGLRDFFKDMKSVQQDLRDTAEDSPLSMKQSMYLIDEQLTNCVQELRQSVAKTIKKS